MQMSEDEKIADEQDINDLIEKVTTIVNFPVQMVTECMDFVVKRDAMIQKLAKESREETLRLAARIDMLAKEMGDK